MTELDMMTGAIKMFEQLSSEDKGKAILGITDLLEASSTAREETPAPVAREKGTHTRE